MSTGNIGINIFSCGTNVERTGRIVDASCTNCFELFVDARKLGQIHIRW